MVHARTTFPNLALAALVLVLVLAGCSSDPEEQALPTIRQSAEEMIRSDVADRSGLGDLSPVCPEVAAPVVGTTWACSATTSDLRTVDVGGVINSEGRIELATGNLITAAALPSFEQAAVAALNQTAGIRLADDVVDCGQDAIVFGAEKVMVCALYDPHTEETYDITLSIEDIESRLFSLVVADQPRP